MYTKTNLKMLLVSKAAQWMKIFIDTYYWFEKGKITKLQPINTAISLTLLGLGLIKINDVSANFNNPRPSLILNN